MSLTRIIPGKRAGSFFARIRNAAGMALIGMCGGAAILCYPAGSSAQTETLELARLTPDQDIPTRLGDLPRPLLSADMAGYRTIFELQEKGQWKKADKFIRQLKNKLLMGQVLAQRYLHPTAYRSEYEELRKWLEEYADLPDADTIYALALKRRTKGSEPPKKPVAGFLGGSGQELLEERETGYVSPKKRSKSQSREVRNWLSKIRKLISKDRPTQATRYLNSSGSRHADEVEKDLARWIIAKGYFANRKDDKALEYARPAANRSGSVEPRIHWTTGLAAWRSGKMEIAGEHFSKLALSDAPGADRAGAAFWASRVFLALRRPDLHRQYLEIAAEASDEFYGLLARGLLDLPIEFEWHETGLRSDMLDLLVRFPGSRRAIALGQIGQNRLAAREIRKLAARARPQLTEALAALAESLRLPATQMRVAQRLRLQDGRSHDGAMYPVPAWQPDAGFDIDRALLFSLMRAESGFNPNAKSHAGALGLMQVLPRTAKMVARKNELEYSGEESLKDPIINMNIGQAYVERLLDNGIINGSLLHTVVAYNAGLKRLEAWVKRFKDMGDDPLLFLESVPIPETRLYAKKVMSNVWAYRARLEQPPTSMTQLAENKWPIYSGYDYDLRYVRKD